MGTDGGTKFYCGVCEAVTICKSVWPDDDAYDKPGLYHMPDVEVQFRSRVRLCQSCGYTFETYEMDALEFSRLADSVVELHAEAEPEASVSLDSEVEEAFEALRLAQPHIELLFDLLANDTIREQIGYDEDETE